VVIAFGFVVLAIQLIAETLKTGAVVFVARTPEEDL
jgi:hypothetical protein